MLGRSDFNDTEIAAPRAGIIAVKTGPARNRALAGFSVAPASVPELTLWLSRLSLAGVGVLAMAMAHRFLCFGFGTLAQGLVAQRQSGDGAAQVIRYRAVGAGALAALGDLAQQAVADHASDSHFHRMVARHDAALAQHLMGAADVDRQHVASAAQDQVAGAALELLERSVGGTRAFGKH